MKERKCPLCGELIDKYAHTCPYCGEDLRTKEKTPSNIFAIMGIIVLALLVLGMFLFNDKIEDFINRPRPPQDLSQKGIDTHIGNNRPETTQDTYMEANTGTTTMPVVANTDSQRDKVNKEFNDFMTKFSHDPEYQLSHIKFPLSNNYNDKSDWKTISPEYFFSGNNNIKGVDFVSSTKKYRDDKIVYSLNNSDMRYYSFTFEKIDGEWMMVDYYDIANNSNHKQADVRRKGPFEHIEDANESDSPANGIKSSIFDKDKNIDLDDFIRERSKTKPPLGKTKYTASTNKSAKPSNTATAKNKQAAKGNTAKKMGATTRTTASGSKKNPKVSKTNAGKTTQNGRYNGSTPQSSGSNGHISSRTPNRIAGRTATNGIRLRSSYTLNDRTIIGTQPAPACEEIKEGRIVIKITVDPDGNVITANIGQGTNIKDRTICNKAIEAALRTRFNRIGESYNQNGTITYIYRR